MSSEGGRPLADAGKLHRLAGIVGRFHEAETGRQQEGPVEAQSAHGLLRHDKLLCLLARNTGKVLTHTYITQNIWSRSWENDIASLRVFMVTLRKKLEAAPDSPQYIQIHIGIGYRMMKVE